MGTPVTYSHLPDEWTAAQRLCLLVTLNNYNTMSQLHQQQEQQKHTHCTNNSVHVVNDDAFNNIILGKNSSPMLPFNQIDSSPYSPFVHSRCMVFPSCFYGSSCTTGYQDELATSSCSSNIRLLLNQTFRSRLLLLSSQIQTVDEYKLINNQDTGAWMAGMSNKQTMTTTPTSTNTIANTNTEANATTLVQKEHVIKVVRKRTLHETLSSKNDDNNDAVVKEKKQRNTKANTPNTTNKNSTTDMNNNNSILFGYNPGILKPLSCPDDKSNTFYGFTKLLREQIYFCHASQYDVSGNTCGRNKPIRVGQIGIVCKHCVHTPPGLRTKGASYFPSKLKYIYQSSQNMYYNHLMENCHNIPSATRMELEKLRFVNRKEIKKSMWITSCIKMGIVECGTDDEQSYLQFRSTIASDCISTSEKEAD